MAAVPTATKAKAALELPVVQSKYEPCPDFAEGAATSGKWSINHVTGKNGTSFYFSYGGSPVKVSFWSVLFGSFDFNDWNGNPTVSCRISSTAILPANLSEQAKKAVIDSLAQIKADQTIFLDVFKKFIKANPKIVPPDTDQETGQPIEKKISIILKRKAPKIDPAKPNKDLTPFYSIGVTLQTDKIESNPNPKADQPKGDVKGLRINTPIIINGKQAIHTRGSLYDAIKGKRFIKHSEGELTGFSGTMGTFLTIKSTIERLQQFRGSGEPTPEEMKKMVEETVGMFANLGIEVGDVAEAAADDAEKKKAEAPVAAASGELPSASFGNFTEIKPDAK